MDMTNIKTPNDLIGLTVDVIPNKDDSFHEFQGTIIGIKNQYWFQVRDQDDDVYDVFESQLTFNP